MKSASSDNGPRNRDNRKNLKFLITLFLIKQTEHACHRCPWNWRVHGRVPDGESGERITSIKYITYSLRSRKMKWASKLRGVDGYLTHQLFISLVATPSNDGVIPSHRARWGKRWHSETSLYIISQTVVPAPTSEQKHADSTFTWHVSLCVTKEYSVRGS